MDTQLPTSLKPKHLSFDEMWQVHKKYTSKENSSILDVADFLYPKRDKWNFSDLLYYVINGLNSNNYSTFSEFIKNLSK